MKYHEAVWGSILFLILLLIAWIVLVPLGGPHDTPISVKNTVSSAAIIHSKAPSSLSLTNDKAILWWKVYRTSLNDTSSEEAAKAANDAVKSCYGTN
jgi:hypothetical protein